MANGGAGGTPLAILAEEIRSGYVIRETHTYTFGTGNSTMLIKVAPLRQYFSGWVLVLRSFMPMTRLLLDDFSYPFTKQKGLVDFLTHIAYCIVTDYWN